MIRMSELALEMRINGGMEIKIEIEIEIEIERQIETEGNE